MAQVIFACIIIYDNKTTEVNPKRQQIYNFDFVVVNNRIVSMCININCMYLYWCFFLPFIIFPRAKTCRLMSVKSTVVALFPSSGSKCCSVSSIIQVIQSSNIKRPLIPLAVPLISDEQICPSLLFPVNKHLHPVDTLSRSNPLLSLIGLGVTDGTVQGRVDRHCNKTDNNSTFICLSELWCEAAVPFS